ncbi:unnamed protein product, partial [Mesorhabditis belari]|uniref:t-SNARE coiled-coil homology domain-containing protein n=1 Tax=Mesorhabditis belari TaxID=2138241 RepID=A0AAF3EL34_9BILA
MTTSARHLSIPSSSGHGMPKPSSSAPSSPTTLRPKQGSSPSPPTIRKKAVKSTDQVPDLLDVPQENKPHFHQKLKLKIIDFDAEIEKMKNDSVNASRQMVFDIEVANMEGIRALSMLEEQDEKLDQIQTDLETIHNDMSEVKKDIGKMNRVLGCIPKKILSCIPISKCSRSNTADFEVYRRASQPAIQVSLKKNKLHEKRSETPTHRLTGDSAAEDELEANLRQANEGVNNLRHLSIDIHSQLMIQDPKLNMLVSMAENSSAALGGAHKEVKKLIGD